MRVESRLPAIADEVTYGIAEHLDELLDIKQMITGHLKEHPELRNRLFLEVGDRELKFIINSGFLIGSSLGVFTILLFLYIGRWWVLPVAGVCVGYLTNWIALNVISCRSRSDVSARFGCWGCSSGANPKPRRSTPKLSPTKSSPSATWLTTSCTAANPIRLER